MKWYEDPVYIEMCTKAAEIQAGWKPQEWDHVYEANHIEMRDGETLTVGRTWCVLPNGIADGGFYGPYVDCQGNFSKRVGDCIWLPRLDQLMGMLPDSDYALFYDGNQFTMELRSGQRVIRGNTPRFYAPSAEQAVLMALMWELHGKRWTGKEWKSID